MTVTVWADADSLPAAARELIARRAASPREPGLRAVFVANRPVPLPRSDSLSFILAPPGEGSADAIIEEGAATLDLVVTRDLPLAERIVMKGIAAVNDRGEAWTEGSVRERRSLAEHMRALRASGAAPAIRASRSYGKAELKAFADAFDRVLSRLLRAARESHGPLASSDGPGTGGM